MNFASSLVVWEWVLISHQLQVKLCWPQTNVWVSNCLHPIMSCLDGLVLWQWLSLSYMRRLSTAQFIPVCSQVCSFSIFTRLSNLGRVVLLLLLYRCSHFASPSARCTCIQPASPLAFIRVRNKFSFYCLLNFRFS